MLPFLPRTLPPPLPPSLTHKVTGTAYFTTGCALVIALFPEDIAITSMLYLVIGDMIAALIGVSFGGDACVVKLGREGKKSVEARPLFPPLFFKNLLPATYYFGTFLTQHSAQLHVTPHAPCDIAVLGAPCVTGC